MLERSDVSRFEGNAVPEGTGSMNLGEWLKKAVLRRLHHAERPERDRLRPLLQELAAK
jgi:hypothetical protein